MRKRREPGWATSHVTWLEACDMPAASHKGETLQAAMHGRCRCYRTDTVR